MIIGYARVSTQDQNPQLQLDALGAAGCEQVFHEKATGKLRERVELTACLRSMRKGDTLVVWKLDRLARSLRIWSRSSMTSISVRSASALSPSR